MGRQSLLVHGGESENTLSRKGYAQGLMEEIVRSLRDPAVVEVRLQSTDVVVHLLQSLLEVLH